MKEQGPPEKETGSTRVRIGPWTAAARRHFVPAEDCAACAPLTTWLLFALWVLNAADFTLTANALSLGIADEANRVMAFFLDAGLGYAFVFKIGVVTAGVLALWLLRRRRVTLVATAALAFAYALVVVYQLAIYWRVVML